MDPESAVQQVFTLGFVSCPCGLVQLLLLLLVWNTSPGSSESWRHFPAPLRGRWLRWFLTGLILLPTLLLFAAVLLLSK